MNNFALKTSRPRNRITVSKNFNTRTYRCIDFLEPPSWYACAALLEFTFSPLPPLSSLLALQLVFPDQIHILSTFLLPPLYRRTAKKENPIYLLSIMVDPSSSALQCAGAHFHQYTNFLLFGVLSRCIYRMSPTQQKKNRRHRTHSRARQDATSAKSAGFLTNNSGEKVPGDSPVAEPFRNLSHLTVATTNRKTGNTAATFSHSYFRPDDDL